MTLSLSTTAAPVADELASSMPPLLLTLPWSLGPLLLSIFSRRTTTKNPTAVDDEEQSSASGDGAPEITNKKRIG